MNDPYKVTILRSLHVPAVGTDGNIHNVTRVAIMVGAYGPFTQDFGPGQAYPDTADGINLWKQDMVTKQMQIGATTS